MHDTAILFLSGLLMVGPFNYQSIFGMIVLFQILVKLLFFHNFLCARRAQQACPSGLLSTGTNIQILCPSVAGLNKSCYNFINFQTKYNLHAQSLKLFLSSLFSIKTWSRLVFKSRHKMQPNP